MRKIFFKPGFTLLELLVVMAILGILSTIGIGSFLSSQVKSRDAKRKSDLNNIVAALEMYYNDKGEYPGENSFHIAGCPAYPYCEWGSEWSQATPPVVYMAQLPKDPSSYTYFYDGGGDSYMLFARLENLKDKDVQEGSPEGGFRDTACGPALTPECNYVVASTNATLPALQ